jgi:hypothetical protein
LEKLPTVFDVLGPVKKVVDGFEKKCKIVTVEFETRRSVETPNRRGRV